MCHQARLLPATPLKGILNVLRLPWMTPYQILAA
jgi:hypothetical protein